MSIRPPLAVRLIWIIGGGGTALVSLVLIAYFWVTLQNPQVLFGLLITAVFVFGAYSGGRSSWLKVDVGSVGYHPSVGVAKVVPRQRLAAVVRVSVGEGVKTLEFRGHDGNVLFVAQESFSRSDVQRLAEYVGVPLTWHL